MTASIFSLAFLLFVCVAWKTATAAGPSPGAECYKCKAGLSAKECNNTATNITCPQDFTECFSLSAYFVNGSSTTLIGMKGCRNPTQDNACNKTCSTVNETLGDAHFSNCIIECCDKNACNNGSYPYLVPLPTTASPLSTTAGPTAEKNPTNSTTGPKVEPTSKASHPSGNLIVFITAFSVLLGLATQN